MIGGTGPSGIPIVARLVDHGHDVTILHRGSHERPETPPDLAHIHADPYDEVSLRRGARRDVVGCHRGHVRAPAHDRPADRREVRPLRVRGRRARLPGVDDAWLHDPPGLPVPVGEDARLVDDPAIDEKGYRIVRTEAGGVQGPPERGALSLSVPLRPLPAGPAGVVRSCGASSTAGDDHRGRRRAHPAPSLLHRELRRRRRARHRAARAHLPA